ncbi:MAG: carbamate kinase, partial [Ignavibacteria bacterium]
LIITHGNGPQVGNILLRNDAGYNQFKIPKMPLDICVADSQGGIGYMIERQLRNILSESGIKRNVITVVSEVLVDLNDPAFKNPEKPVGTFYLREEADLLAKTNNFVFKEDSRKRGWRRVVASPRPVDILNKEILKDLAEKGNIVIAAGGGGVPVYLDERNLLQGIEAVIDKDLASSLLAAEVGAEELIILTDITHVYLNFGKPDQTPLVNVNVKEIKEYLNSGQFASGSMEPKILAAVEFIEKGGKCTLITEAAKLSDNSAGTRITA